MHWWDSWKFKPIETLKAGQGKTATPGKSIETNKTGSQLLNLLEKLADAAVCRLYILI